MIRFYFLKQIGGISFLLILIIYIYHISIISQTLFDMEAISSRMLSDFSKCPLLMDSRWRKAGEHGPHLHLGRYCWRDKEDLYNANCMATVGSGP